MCAYKDEWTGLMRAAINGDGIAYHRLLRAVTPVLRAAARRGLARAGQPVDQSEDIVQDILLAVHLKRHTWDANAPFAPWLFAIARNKLIDALRRRGRRVFVNIEDFMEILPSEPVRELVSASEFKVQLDCLPRRQRDVVQLIAVESTSIKDTAARLTMSEGAVRVALHSRIGQIGQAAEGILMNTDQLIQTLVADTDRREPPLDPCSQLRWRPAGRSPR